MCLDIGKIIFKVTFNFITILNSHRVFSQKLNLIYYYYRKRSLSYTRLLQTCEFFLKNGHSLELFTVKLR